MPTIIDNLQIVLTLNANQFTQGAQQIQASLQNVKVNMQGAAQNMASSGQKLGSFFAGLRGQVMGLVGAFATLAGVRSITGLIENVNKADSSLSRMSRWLEISRSELQLWRNAMRLVNGTAEDADQSFSALADQVRDFQLNASNSSYFRVWQSIQSITDASGRQIVNLANLDTGKLEDMTKLASELQEAFAVLQQRPGGRQEAIGLAKATGFTPAFIDLLIRGKTEYDSILKQASASIQKIDESTDATDRWNRSVAGLQESFEGLWRNINAGTAGASKWIDDLANSINALNKKTAEEGWWSGFAKWFGPAAYSFAQPGVIPGTGGNAPSGTGKMLGGPLASKRNDFGGAPGDNQAQKDISRLMQLGNLTWDQAAGIVANITAESRGDPHAHNEIGGGHYGLVQLSAKRQADFKRIMKKDIRKSSRDEQLQFIIWELQNTETGAMADLRRQTTASGAALSFGTNFERYSAKEAIREDPLRQRYGMGLSQGAGYGQKQSAAPLTKSETTVSINSFTQVLPNAKNASTDAGRGFAEAVKNGLSPQRSQQAQH